MFCRILPVVLALLIAACPLTCRLIPVVSCDGVVQPADEHTLCHNCHGEKAGHHEDDSQDQIPAPTCPCQNECRDCICCGAVIDTGDDFEPVLLPSLDLPADLTSSLASSTHERCDLRVCEGHIPVLSGRCMRALISSFLC
jgi:hypothetical protein